MSDITLSDAQAEAVKKIKHWFKYDTNHQQVFRLLGVPGSGKSTIIKHVTKELKLDDVTYTDNDKIVPNVLHATFTNKASLVLTRKGSPCRSIHSLTQIMRETNEEAIERAEDELNELQKKVLTSDGTSRLELMKLIRKKKDEIDEMYEPKWSLNEKSDIRDCKLVVVDEISMVGESLGLDLLSYGKPVLVLGDPWQLPPINGTGFFTEGAKPDVMLTEIHRQARESPIIRLAEMVREGKQIPFGRYDDNVYKLPRHAITPEQMLKADQVLCGKHVTRRMLNTAMRKALGHTEILPEDHDEKIICLQNYHKVGLINGMFVSLHRNGSYHGNSRHFMAEIVSEDGFRVPSRSIYTGHFVNNYEYDKERERRDRAFKKQIVEADYGYAITIHKSQGSQYKNIIVYDDHLFRDPLDYAKLMNTAITRAETGLLILE